MTIKVEKIKEEKKKNKIIFLLKGTDEVFANTIRRLILEEVPTLAIEDLEIKDNNSALYDEMVALRMGLVPIKTDLKSYEMKEKCKCEGAGCARCELKITLKSSKKGYVYAGESVSTDPKCTFAYDKMPVVKLLAKQKIDMIMTANLNCGKEHAKWSPGMAFYRKEPVVKLGKIENQELLAKKCTDGVFDFKGKVSVVQEKLYESNLLEYYAEIEKGVSLDYTDNIIFTLESWGQLSHKNILGKSAEILAEKANELMKLI